jgi:hypothetical protein
LAKFASLCALILAVYLAPNAAALLLDEITQAH